MQKFTPAAKILIVEDNEADIHLFREFFSDIRMLNEISWARTGEEALRFVREHRPEVVILDTILPLRDGFEVLGDIKADPDLRDINVILSVDTGELPYVKKHAPMADGYIQKPIDFRNLVEVISRTDRFGVAIVRCDGHQ
jgi:CheY-like chemotaxis protein